MSKTDCTVNVDEYLAANKYEVDEESAHIELVDDPPTPSSTSWSWCARPPSTNATRAVPSPSTTPAAWSAACRIACGDTIVKKWRYPGPTMGVEYRFG